MNVASTSFTKQFGVLMAIYGPPFPNSGGPLQRGRLTLIDIEKPIAVNTNIDSFNAEIDAYLSPDVGLLKVVQEAINNAVHRAKCECLDIRFNIIEGHILEVTIENTGGQTLDMSKIEKTPGFGLKNMKRRILDSNGEFSIVSIDGGARLRFTCPLSPVQA